MRSAPVASIGQRGVDGISFPQCEVDVPSDFSMLTSWSRADLSDGLRRARLRGGNAGVAHRARWGGRDDRALGRGHSLYGILQRGFDLLGLSSRWLALVDLLVVAARQQQD